MSELVWVRRLSLGLLFACETAERLCRLCAIRMERRFTNCTFAEAMTKIRGEGGLKLQDLLDLLEQCGDQIFQGNCAISRPAPLAGGLPRPEGPRQSLRSGSRSDSFRGPGRAGCTEMHYSPKIWPRTRGRAGSFPPLLPSSPSSPPHPPAQPAQPRLPTGMPVGRAQQQACTETKIFSTAKNKAKIV